MVTAKGIRTMYVYYSKFDKHHYIDFHLVQCNELTTLALGNFRCFSLISTNFSVAMRLLQATGSNTNHILAVPVYARWQNVVFTLEKCILFKW